MISYQDDIDGVRPERLTGFWVGWPSPPTTEQHLRVLEGSEAVVLVVDREADRIIGFITAIGDGVLASDVTFLEVLPAYQGRGIGTELLRRMLARLVGRYMIDLVCDDDLVPFYERQGMTRWGAMVKRRPEVLARTDRAAPDRDPTTLHADRREPL